MHLSRRLFRCAVSCLTLAAVATATGQPPEPMPDPAADNAGFRQRQRPPLTPLPTALRQLTEESTPLNPGPTVFLNLKKKSVYLHTEVVCRDCILEMLCVPIGQREHETILNVRSQAYVIHAALLALGLKPGKPVEFYPDYHPPEGPVLNLHVHWVDDQGKTHREDARSWIRHSLHRYFSRPLAQAPPRIKLPHEELRYDPYNKEILWYGPMTDKQRRHLLTLWDDEKYQSAIEDFFQLGQSRPMEAEFVFTGSRWATSELTDERRYAAEDGHFITVANFPAATIDVAEKSSASDGGQLYEGWAQKIPPKGTPVLLEISAAEDRQVPTRRKTSSSEDDQTLEQDTPNEPGDTP